MSVSSTTYFGGIRVREQSPEAKDWAATDYNPELFSKLLKYFEQHSHSGVAAINYPGYNSSNPDAPVLPTISEFSTGGIISPGTSLGVRLAYVNTLGLETDASAEVAYIVAAGGVRPLTPQLVTTTPAAGGVSGGTYIYAITKAKGSGETVISDILPVSIPFDTTYSVTLSFDPINSYTDSTTAIKIYRSAGLNQSFQLVGTVTSTTATSFVDTNTISVANSNVQPPSVSTFDANKKIRITWSALTHPADASKMRVYVTQQTGLWSVNHLLSEIDLSGTPPNFIDYLGSEGLLPGWPNESSQIPSSSPKINLANSVTGALTLDSPADFTHQQISNFRLKNGAAPGSPANGDMYYDTSISTIRAYINGGWVSWGTTTASAYTHPSEESGGHLAANIKFVTGSAVTAKSVFDTLRNSDGTQKNLTKIYKAAGSATTTTTGSSTPVLMTDMTLSVTPNFDNQWLEIQFSGNLLLDTTFAILNYSIEYDGSSIEETVRSITAGAINSNFSASTSYTVQMGTAAAGAKIVRVLWWVSGGTATAQPLRRSLVAKLLA